MVHRLTREQARRVALRAQGLQGPRPVSGTDAGRDEVLDAVRTMGLLQLEPTAAIAPTAHLTLWSRLGSSYDRRSLDDLADSLELIELDQTLRAPEDLAAHRAVMAQWPGRGDLRPWQRELAGWVEANAACRRDLLARLRSDGPLSIVDLPDTCEVPWRSSGWNDGRNVRKLLDLMVHRGEVAPSGGRGRDRLWDLAERVYPDDPLPAAEQAETLLAERRLRSLGIARSRAAFHSIDPLGVGEAGLPATVEGVRGSWRVDPARLEDLDEPYVARAALLSPFDRFVHDRKRLLELFEYEYLLEMYKPAAQRRWGYYALPVLVGDHLVGKLDARADRDAGLLRVTTVHLDVDLDAGQTAAVDAEIADVAHWLRLEVVRV